MNLAASKMTTIGSNLGEPQILLDSPTKPPKIWTVEIDQGVETWAVVFAESWRA